MSALLHVTPRRSRSEFNIALVAGRVSLPLPAMSSLYTALRVTPRKKRAPAEDSDDDDLLTPKKMRMACVYVFCTRLRYKLTL